MKIGFTIILFVSWSCNSSALKEKGVQTQIYELSKDPILKKEVKANINYVQKDSVFLLKRKYTAIRDKWGLVLLNQKLDTLFKFEDCCFGFGFEDINKDGFKDFFYENSSNASPIRFVYLFNRHKRKFIKVKGFEEFLDAKKIGKTNYYYSYHKSGCADLNWDSDLFYIENYKAIKIGNISGKGCDDEHPRMGIYISKMVKGIRKFYERKNIRVIEKYDDYKWDFIKDYWSRNYLNFADTSL